MLHQCYYCEQIFQSKEQLYDHLEVHSKPQSQQKNQEKMRIELKKAARRSRKLNKPEGKVSASESKKNFTMSQKRVATIKKSRN